MRRRLCLAWAAYLHSTHAVVEQLAEGAAGTGAVAAFAGGNPLEVAADGMLLLPEDEVSDAARSSMK